MAGTVLAQNSEDSGDEVLEEIIVTGTRIKRQDFESPNPVSTWDAAELENLGIVDIGELAEMVSSNLSNFQPENTGGGAFFVGSTIANLRGMNPFFGTRTLTMMNSRRMAPTTQGDSVDLRMIPTVMVSRVEVVTGGASAAYGTGAVAGVVNVIMNNNMRGIRLDADYGLTSRGDANNWRVGLSTGRSFANGRGSFSIGGEFQDRSVVQSCADARFWCAEADGLYSNSGSIYRTSPAPATTINYKKIEGMPANYRITDRRTNQLSHTGVLWERSVAAATTWQFNEAGTAFIPYTIGDNLNPTLATFGPPSYATPYRSTSDTIVGGDGELVTKNQTMYPQSERLSIYGNASFRFSDRLTGRFTLSYATNEAYNRQWQANANEQDICITYYDAQDHNPFLDTLSATDLQRIRDVRWTAAEFGFGGNSSSGSPPTVSNLLCGNRTTPGAGALIPTEPRYNPSNGTGVWKSMLRKDWSDQVDRYVITDTETINATLALEGELGDQWFWDLSYRYGMTKRDQALYGQASNWRFTLATDVVKHPVTGEPICRVNHPDFRWDNLPSGGTNPPPTRNRVGYYEVAYANYATSSGARRSSRELDQRLAEGCVPLNPFGMAASPEALAYAFGDLTEHNDIRNDSFDLTLSGPVWDGVGAGPFLGAVGLTYTVNQLVNYAGDLPEYIRADYQAQYGNTFGGRTRSYEAFSEIRAPLLLDKPYIRRLEVGGSLRITHDRNRGTSGTEGVGGYQKTMSWRLTSIYEPAAWLGFNLTYSRDMRAASFRELYYGQTRGGGLTQVCNPWSDGTSCFIGNDDITMLIGGTPNLDPEVSKNLTAGIILRPDFSGALRGLNFRASLYQMSLGGGQTLTGPQEIIADCFNDVPEACALMGFDPTPRDGYPTLSPENLAKSNISWVQTKYVNREKQVQRGIDFEISHYLNLETLLGWRGTLNFRVSATHTLDVLAPT
ncbi:MAG: TonB-dependent receptor, partial [Gammaproteobacteria bacterium]|nr:TonB-dependent receptor [Gammaproteobacteria bacterium]